MKKHLFVFLMAFFVCQVLNAQHTDELKYFNLVMPDNSLVSYELSDGVDIHFQDSIMVVNDLSFYMDDIVKYYFSEVDINTVVDETDDNTSYIGGDQLFVKGTDIGDIVISDVLGRVVYSKPNCKECVVDLSSLNRNVLYVVRVNSQTLKFIRK